MNKEKILQFGNSPKILKYIIDTDKFDMEDYRILVKNDKVKTLPPY